MPSSARCCASRIWSSRSTRWIWSTTRPSASPSWSRSSAQFAGKLDVADITYIPISALCGDNVVEPSERLSWYDGPTLLGHLEEVEVSYDHPDEVPARFPVQWVVKPAVGDYRGYAGQLASGALRTGEEVVVLPGGRRTRIAAIDTFDGELEEAVAPLSVTLRLEDEIDVARGELICHPDAAPSVGRELEADLCWMGEAPLRPGGRYAIKHTSRNASAIVDTLHDRVDVHTLERRTGAGRARAQRHRAGVAAHERSAGVRRVSVQPAHRELHPDRRVDQRHGRRRDGPGRSGSRLRRVPAPLPRSPEGRLDVSGQQVEIELVGVVGIERIEAESPPPGPSRCVERCHYDSPACRFFVELGCRRENMGRERGPDSKARVVAIDREPSQQQRRHRIRRTLCEHTRSGGSVDPGHRDACVPDHDIVAVGDDPGGRGVSVAASARRTGAATRREPARRCRSGPGHAGSGQAAPAGGAQSIQRNLRLRRIELASRSLTAAGRSSASVNAAAASRDRRMLERSARISSALEAAA